MKKFNPMLIILHVRELWNRDVDLQEVLDNYYNKGEDDTLISSLDIQDANLSNFVTNNQMNNVMETKSNLVHKHSANDIT